jgi:hypothetical protein
MFIIGLDLGQARDYTALAIIEKLEQKGSTLYHVRKLERTRGIPYPDVVTRVKEIVAKLKTSILVIDGTGVGRPVVDMLASLKPVAIYIHGGYKVSHDGGTYGVPQRDLAAVLQVLVQNQRFKIAPGPLSEVLASEMLNFKVKIDPETAHDSYSAWRESEHDDLVLSVALACWYGEHMLKPIYMLKPVAFYSGVGYDVPPDNPRTSDPYSSTYSLTRTPRPNF